MLRYKGKLLTKIEDQTGGKNKNKINGFYQDTDGVEFFIKKPVDPKELFTELFAGLLLQEFKERNLIPGRYHDCLICADVIQFEEGSYGLIQPRVRFTELYKIIGTGYSSGSDRNPIREIFIGTESYPLLIQEGPYFGLSIALLFSLLMGDYSVHSGNVVCLGFETETGEQIIQFARIDWGASFRHFANKKNNTNILYPFEYQGLFNLKGITKGYIYNYKYITGLFPAIAEKAKDLMRLLNDSLLVDTVYSTVQKIPTDLISGSIKKELAKYMGINSFAHVVFGIKEHCEQFINDFSEILYSRLEQITLLQDFYPGQKRSGLYKSMIIDNTSFIPDYAVNPDITLPKQIQLWNNILTHPVRFAFNSIDLSLLVEQFNQFIEATLRQAELLDNEQLKFLASAPTDEESMIAAPISNSELLRYSFTLNNDATPISSSDGAIHLKDYGAKTSYWTFIEIALTAAFHVIVTIRILQNTQALKIPQVARRFAIDFLLDTLKDRVDFFQVSYQSLVKHELAIIRTLCEKTVAPERNSEFTPRVQSKMSFFDPAATELSISEEKRTISDNDNNEFYPE